MPTVDDKTRLVSRDGLHDMINDYMAMFGSSTKFLNIMTLHDYLKNRDASVVPLPIDGLHRLCKFCVSDMKDVDLLDCYKFIVNKSGKKRGQISEWYLDKGVD